MLLLLLLILLVFLILFHYKFKWLNILLVWLDTWSLVLHSWSKLTIPRCTLSWYTLFSFKCTFKNWDWISITLNNSRLLLFNERNLGKFYFMLYIVFESLLFKYICVNDSLFHLRLYLTQYYDQNFINILSISVICRKNANQI